MITKTLYGTLWILLFSIVTYLFFDNNVFFVSLIGIGGYIIFDILDSKLAKKKEEE